MPQITLNIKSKVDINQIISASDLKKIFLAGIPLDKLDLLSDETIDFYINAAIDFIEQQLTIKLNKQIVTEDKDFDSTNWSHWNHITLTYPAQVGVSLYGYLGKTKQVNYPKSWISCRKTSDGVLYSRNIALVPSTNAAQNELIIYSGIMPNTGFFTGNKMIPNYWTIEYVTGFDKIPPTIIQAIGMCASIQLLNIISDMIVKGSKSMPGIGFGVSSNSISLDGLSLNSGSFLNGNNSIFSARIKQLQDQLLNPDKGLLQSLRDYYGGMIMLGC